VCWRSPPPSANAGGKRLGLPIRLPGGVPTRAPSASAPENGRPPLRRGEATGMRPRWSRSRWLRGAAKLPLRLRLHSGRTQQQDKVIQYSVGFLLFLGVLVRQRAPSQGRPGGCAGHSWRRGRAAMRLARPGGSCPWSLRSSTQARSTAATTLCCRSALSFSLHWSLCWCVAVERRQRPAHCGSVLMKTAGVPGLSVARAAVAVVPRRWPRPQVQVLPRRPHGQHAHLCCRELPDCLLLRRRHGVVRPWSPWLKRPPNTMAAQSHRGDRTGLVVMCVRMAQPGQHLLRHQHGGVPDVAAVLRRCGQLHLLGRVGSRPVQEQLHRHSPATANAAANHDSQRTFCAVRERNKYS